jgi:hypothetical protein
MLPPSDSASPSVAANPKVKSLKERLSDKASDEQRVDDCGIPAEKRGASRRPTACASATPPAAR